MNRLTVALDMYDRHLPFFDGSVKLDGIETDFLAVGQSRSLLHGSKRHRRMLVDQEFDVAELSLSSYLMARNSGLPFTAIPIFPRRLFSMSQMWTKRNSDARSPKDLAGKRVGLSSFQTTLSVLAKGDIGAEYGVPWREINWVTTSEEVVTPKSGEKRRFENSQKKVFELLRDDDVQAIFVPHPPKQVLEDTENYRRLFSNPREEEVKYYQKNGYFPIMHVIAIKDSTLKKIPDLPKLLTKAFEESKEVCRERYDDPNWSYLVWGRLELEEQNRVLGREAWNDGVGRNRKNLLRFVEYSLDQGLVSERLGVEDLFHESTLD